MAKASNVKTATPEVPDKTTEEHRSSMWTAYQVVLQVDGEFAAAIPRTREEIVAMLTHRMPGRLPANAIPLDDLAEQVLGEVSGDAGADAEATVPTAEPFVPGWSTFKRDEGGLYYEGRCVRGHLKDCALQVAQDFSVRNFRAKFVNAVYVSTTKIYLGRQEPDGCELRYIQVLTRQGPRSTIKYVDYVLDPTLTFALKLKAKTEITPDHLRAVFAYGEVHGMGQERSQGWGRYTLTSLRLLPTE